MPSLILSVSKECKIESIVRELSKASSAGRSMASAPYFLASSKISSPSEETTILSNTLAC